jgi:hypothetical protein
MSYDIVIGGEKNRLKPISIGEITDFLLSIPGILQFSERYLEYEDEKEDLFMAIYLEYVNETGVSLDFDRGEGKDVRSFVNRVLLSVPYAHVHRHPIDHVYVAIARKLVNRVGWAAYDRQTGKGIT